MSSKINIIDVIIAKTGMKQLDIAKKLDVSRAQVSKWKSGEDIPADRRKVLNEMAGLFGDDVEWSILTKTPENAEKWIHFFKEYHENYLEVDPCNKLSEDPEDWVPEMLVLFDKVGIKIPETAPDPDSEDDGEDMAVAFYSLVREYLESYAALTNWYEINIGELSDLDDDILGSTFDFEHYITEFALVYVDKNILDSLCADHSKVSNIVAEARKNLSKLIIDIVKIMVNKNLPIMRDYFALINAHPYNLDDDQMCRSVKLSVGNCTIESMLPLFEKILLERTKFLTELIAELHLKIDTLIKPEDREELSKVIEHTPPSRNVHLTDKKSESSESTGEDSSK